MAANDYVREKTCLARHRGTKAMMGIVLGLVGLFLAVSAAAWSATNGVSTDTEELKVKIESHMAAEERSDQAIQRKLDDLQRSTEANRELLVKLLQDRRP